jgi:hypothetical protein
MRVAPSALERETIMKASAIGNSSKSEPTSFATDLELFGGVEKGCSIQDAQMWLSHIERFKSTIIYRMLS